MALNPVRRGPARPDSERDFAERLNKIAGIEQQQAIIEELGPGQLLY